MKCEACSAAGLQACPVLPLKKGLFFASLCCDDSSTHAVRGWKYKSGIQDHAGP